MSNEINNSELEALKIFKDIKTVPDFFNHLDIILNDVYSNKNLIKPATAMCRDDSVTGIIHELENRGYMAPFNMETLSGVPVFGNTGYGAFYHHIPDDGIGLIIYAPHVGLSSEGNYGDLERPGKKEMGKSCGANHTIINNWKENNYSNFENDPELSQVSKILFNKKEEILNAKEPILKIMEEEYKLGLEKFTNDIINLKKREHHDYPILLVSGIHIDTREEIDNMFELRDIRLFKKEDYKIINLK